MTDEKKPNDKKEKPRGEKHPEGIPRADKLLRRKPAWDRKGKPDQENR